MEQNDFKAFVFQEFAAIRREMAESARGAKLRKIDPDEESTNSGSGASIVSLPGASAAEEIFATPLSEQPASTRPLLESASALVKAQTWTRSTCQRYFAALRQHREEVPLQPARLETLSFLQLQELCRKLQLPPPVDFKSMPEAKAAVSKKCTGVTGYAVTRFLVEQTARSLAFLAEKDGVLGSGVVTHRHGYRPRRVLRSAGRCRGDFAELPGALARRRGLRLREVGSDPEGTCAGPGAAHPQTRDVAAER